MRLLIEVWRHEARCYDARHDSAQMAYRDCADMLEQAVEEARKLADKR